MKGVCLIPCTRPDVVAHASDSAIKYGWEPIIINDTNNSGVHITRNCLFDAAIKADADVIRYCDDDDTICGVTPQDVYLDAITYFDWKFSGSNYINKFYKNSWKDLELVTPWCWAAPTDILLKVQKSFGKLWDENIPCMEGIWLWSRFLSLKFTFKHIDTVGYEWKPLKSGMHLHPKRDEQISLILQWIEKNKPI